MGKTVAFVATWAESNKSLVVRPSGDFRFPFG